MLFHRLSDILAKDESFLCFVASKDLLAGGGQVCVVGARTQHFSHFVLLLWTFLLDFEAVLRFVFGYQARTVAIYLLYLV